MHSHRTSPDASCIDDFCRVGRTLWVCVCLQVTKPAVRETPRVDDPPGKVTWTRACRDKATLCDDGTSEGRDSKHCISTVHCNSTVKTSVSGTWFFSTDEWPTSGYMDVASQDKEYDPGFFTQREMRVGTE